MYRAAISYYLIFAFSAGPAAFCCCALKAMAAPFHTAATNSAVSPEAGGCPHCKKDQGEKPAAPDKSPEKDRCPCKEHGSTAALPDALPDEARAWSAADAWSLAFLSVDATSLHPACSVAPTGPSISAGLRDGPWLSASDLLSTHHVIRC